MSQGNKLVGRKIKLLIDVPVPFEHKMTAGRVLTVVASEHEEPIDGGGGLGRTRGYWVNGEGEQVLVLRHECRVVEDED